MVGRDHKRPPPVPRPEGKSRVTAASGDLAYITLTLTDPDGTLHTAADRPAHVKLPGPGTLLAFGSAAPSTEERFDTYEGRALAILRPTAVGKLHLLATAPTALRRES